MGDDGGRGRTMGTMENDPAILTLEEAGSGRKVPALMIKNEPRAGPERSGAKGALNGKRIIL